MYRVDVGKVLGGTRGEGDTWIWFGRESATRASKPVPMFKGHFGRKRYPLLGFSQNFGKTKPCLGIFFVENGTHV